jgi:hypothetical protein
MITLREVQNSMYAQVSFLGFEREIDESLFDLFCSEKSNKVFILILLTICHTMKQ